MKRLSLLILGLGLILTAASTASTIRVPADQATIQAGIDAASNGDTVLVAPGTYNENLTVNNKEICLLSEGGANVTTLTPAITPGNILAYSNNSSKINKVLGFKFTGVNGLHGIELMDGKMVVEECQFTDNVLEGEIGGAVMIWSSAEIRNCLFMNNRGGRHGGGIRWVNYGGGIIEHNEFRGNEAIFGGGIDLLYAKNVLVRYNLFVADSAQARGGAIYYCGSNNIRIINNTIDDCVSVGGNGGGLGGCASSSVTVYNNIIVNCQGAGIWAEGMPTLAYNDCYSNTPRDYYIDYDTYAGGEGAISSDPHFAGGVPFDYHLHGSSPCIDVGNPDPYYNDPNGTRNDMGAFPGGVGSLPLVLRIGFGAGAVNGLVAVPWPTIYWHYFDTAATTQTQFEIEIGGDDDWSVAEMWQSGAVTSSDTATVYAGAPLADRGTYFLRARVGNSSGWGEWSEIVMRMGIGKIIRVPADHPTVQAGINAALSGDTVLVAPGTYAENLTISSKGIVMLSEGGPEVTTLTPASLPSNILQYTTTPGMSNTVQGFTFTGVQKLHCIESTQGKLIVDNCQFTDNVLEGEIGGAVMVWDQAEIRNCIFENNRGGIHGGGIRWVNSGGGVIENNEFRYNSAYYGGGVNLLRAENVIVKYNLFVADSSVEYGGAIYLGNSAYIEMINNTIDSCVSFYGSGGGISIVASDHEISFNNIITNCKGYGIWHFSNINWQPDFDNFWSNTPDNYFGINPGENSLSVDPRFVGGIPFNYHLKGSSPCINAGNPDPLYNDPDSSRNDMGRYFYTITLGDANGDGSTNVADVVFIINYIFIGGAAPQPLAAGDIDCDGSINIGDVVYLIRYIFSGGPAPCADLE